MYKSMYEPFVTLVYQKEEEDPESEFVEEIEAMVSYPEELRTYQEISDWVKKLDVVTQTPPGGWELKDIMIKSYIDV